MANTGMTLIDVRNEAMEAIALLKSNKLDVKTASEIRNLLGVVIDTAKTQVEFLKAIPNSVKEKMNVDEVKAIAGTLRNSEADLDMSLKEIEERRKKPYQES